MPCRLSEHEESAAKINGDHLVKYLDVTVSDSSKRHDARTVHHHVDPAESVECVPEKTLYFGGVRDIGLEGDGLPTDRFDLVHDSLSFAGAAGIVHDDGKTVASEP